MVMIDHADRSIFEGKLRTRPEIDRGKAVSLQFQQRRHTGRLKLRSAEWIRAAGKLTAGVGVIAAPATAALITFDSSPAAAWTDQNCNTWQIGAAYLGVSVKGTVCVSRSGAKSKVHYYRALEYITAAPPTGWSDHVEMSIYHPNGTHTSYNTPSKDHKTTSPPLSVTTGKYYSKQPYIGLHEWYYANGWNSQAYFYVESF